MLILIICFLMVFMIISSIRDHIISKKRLSLMDYIHELHGQETDAGIININFHEKYNLLDIYFPFPSMIGTFNFLKGIKKQEKEAKAHIDDHHLTTLRNAGVKMVHLVESR